MPLSAEELGQLYYDEAGSSSFWQDLIEPYLQVTLPADYFTGQTLPDPNAMYYA